MFLLDRWVIWWWLMMIDDDWWCWWVNKHTFTCRPTEGVYIKNENNSSWILWHIILHALSRLGEFTKILNCQKKRKLKVNNANKQTQTAISLLETQSSGCAGHVLIVSPWKKKLLFTPMTVRNCEVFVIVPLFVASLLWEMLWQSLCLLFVFDEAQTCFSGGRWHWMHQPSSFWTTNLSTWWRRSHSCTSVQVSDTATQWHSDKTLHLH